MAILDSLLVELGFDYDPKGLDDFRAGVQGTTAIVKRLVTAAAAAATAISGLTIASTAASDELGKLSGELGIGVENINALQFALQRSGGSAEGMVSSLRALSAVVGEAARGGGAGVEIFGRLGITVQDVAGRIRPVESIFSELSARFQSLSKAEQIDFAGKLGLNDSIRLLQQGPAEIRRLTAEAKKLGVVSDADAKIAADLQDSLTDLWTITKQFSRLIARTFAPLLKENINLFTEWWKTNRQIIEQNIPAFVDKLTMAFKVLTLAVGAFVAGRLLQHFGQLILAIRSVSVSALVMNAAMLLLPILIGAAALAFVGLLEDAKVFFEGGDSIIGEMIKRFPEWEGVIRGVANHLQRVNTIISAIGTGISFVFNLVTADDPFAKLSESIEQLKKDIDDLLENFIPNIKQKITSVFDAPLEDTAKAINDGFYSILPFGDSLKKASEFGTNIGKGLGGYLRGSDKIVVQAATIRTEDAGAPVDAVTGPMRSKLSSSSFERTQSAARFLLPAAPASGPGSLQQPSQQLSPQALNSRVGTNTKQLNIEKVEINVNGNGDPFAVGQEVKRQFDQTAQDLETAVDY